jgi:hypothetical protein
LPVLTATPSLLFCPCSGPVSLCQHASSWAEPAAGDGAAAGGKQLEELDPEKAARKAAKLAEKLAKKAKAAAKEEAKAAAAAAAAAGGGKDDGGKKAGKKAEQEAKRVSGLRQGAAVLCHLLGVHLLLACWRAATLVQPPVAGDCT